MLQAMKYQYFNKPTSAMEKNDSASCGCVVDVDYVRYFRFCKNDGRITHFQ